MFFEERNTKILCRRVKYVGEGKHKNETVTSFATHVRSVPDEVRELLDECAPGARERRERVDAGGHR